MKLGVMGPSGSGKTYGAILTAHGLADEDPEKILVIDTENQSAGLYAHLNGGFMHEIVKPPFTPAKICQIIRDAVREDIKVIIIDSMSHVWDFILEHKDELDRKGGNGFQNWSKSKVLFKELKECILQSPVHIIACMRSKSEYAIEEETVNGKRRSTVKKIGTSAMVEPGYEFDFSVVWTLDRDTHLASIEKDRTGLFDGKTETLSIETGRRILEWLGVNSDGKLLAGDEWKQISQGPSEEFDQASQDAERYALREAEKAAAIEKRQKDESMAWWKSIGGKTDEVTAARLKGMGHPVWMSIKIAREENCSTVDEVLLYWDEERSKLRQAEEGASTEPAESLQETPKAETPPAAEPVATVPVDPVAATMDAPMPGKAEKPPEVAQKQAPEKIFGWSHLTHASVPDPAKNTDIAVEKKIAAALNRRKVPMDLHKPLRRLISDIGCTTLGTVGEQTLFFKWIDSVADKGLDEALGVCEKVGALATS